MLKKRKIFFNQRGSLTLEAAFILPLFILAIISVISLMEMFKCYQDVEINLYKCTRELAMYMAGKDVLDNFEDNIFSDVAMKVLSEQYTENVMYRQLELDSQSKDMIVDGSNGISLLLSKVSMRDENIFGEDDIIDMVASYEMEPYCNVFGIKPYRMANRCRMHAWTGFGGEDDNSQNNDERIVYITENGTVYHLTRSCTHLTLSISAVMADSIASRRNKEGAKYKECDKCGGAYSPGDVLFITDEGDRYHTTLSCSGLKRTVMEIPISKVGDRKACSRCGE